MKDHVYYIVWNRDAFHGDTLEAYQYEPIREDGRWRSNYNDTRGGVIITRSSASNYLIDDVSVDDGAPFALGFRGSFDEFIDYHIEKAKKWGKKFFLFRDSNGGLWLTTSRSEEYKEKITDNPNFLSNIRYHGFDSASGETHCYYYFYPIDSAGYYFDGVALCLRYITKDFGLKNPYAIEIEQRNHNS